MRIIALLSWYDESEASLGRCIQGLAEHDVADVLLAVDGRYVMFPGDTPNSPEGQQAFIRHAGEIFGIPTHIWQCEEPWETEMAKRSFMFDMGYLLAEPGDWFLVIDADEVIRSVPGDLRDRLAATDHDVAEVEFNDAFLADHPVPGHPQATRVRVLFRAQRIRVEGHHATYVTDDNRVLWSIRRPGEVPALRVPDVIIDHLPHERFIARVLAKQSYYAARDESFIEESV